MTIYVGPLLKGESVVARAPTYSCMLYSDKGIEELNAFASRLGMKAKWVKEVAKLPYYSLTPNMRDVAIRMGATEVEEEKILKLLDDRVLKYESTGKYE